MKPLVSIYMPTLNRRELLERAVQSVISQTFTNWELLIVDDGSTDDTRNYLTEISAIEPRIRVIDKKKIKKGAPFSRNLAIKHAQGEFITGLDDDDFFRPERIEELLRSYQPEFAFIFTRSHYRKDWLFSPLVSLRQRVSFEDLIHINLVGNQILIEASRLRDAGGFDESLLAAQDYDLWLRLTCTFGPALMLRSDSYIVDDKHDGARISDCSVNRANALLQIISKHSGRLSNHQVRSLKLNHLMILNKVTFGDCVRLGSLRSLRLTCNCLKKAVTAS